MNQENDEVIERGQKMEKLLKNKDFQELIIDGFIKLGTEDIMIRYHSIPPDHRDILNEKIVAYGMLNTYINGIIAEGVAMQDYTQEMNEFEREM